MILNTNSDSRSIANQQTEEILKNEKIFWYTANKFWRVVLITKAEYNRRRADRILINRETMNPEVFVEVSEKDLIQLEELVYKWGKNKTAVKAVTELVFWYVSKLNTVRYYLTNTEMYIESAKPWREDENLVKRLWLPLDVCNKLVDAGYKSETEAIVEEKDAVIASLQAKLASADKKPAVTDDKK